MMDKTVEKQDQSHKHTYWPARPKVEKMQEIQIRIKQGILSKATKMQSAQNTLIILHLQTSGEQMRDMSGEQQTKTGMS